MYIMDGDLKIIINCKVRENRSNSILLNMKTSPKCAYFVGVDQVVLDSYLDKRNCVSYLE